MNSSRTRPGRDAGPAAPPRAPGLAAACIAVVLLAAAAGAAAQPPAALTFPNSGAAAAQPAFLEGLAALHNFQFDEAALAFARAQEIDPDFAMAFWGEAISYNHPLWAEQDTAAARGALERLAPTLEGRLAKAGTDKERAYLEAAERLFYGPADKLARDTAYAERMTAMHERWPDDHEIACFYALSLLGTVRPGDTGFRRQARAAAAVLDVFAENPRHPGAAHFIIHAFDDPEHAPLALPAARVYADIAPESAHALHMPSHIFVQLGFWKDVVSSNIASYEAAFELNRRLNLPEGRSDFHALSWLAYGRLMLGRHEEAAEDLRRAREAVARNPGESNVLNGYLTMRARHIVETRRWEAIDVRADRDGGFAAAVPGLDATSANPAWLYAAGASAARRGNTIDATPAETQLARLAMAREIAGDPHGAHELRIMAAEIAAATALAEGREDDAVRRAGQAADLEATLGAPSGPPMPIKPAAELHGEILLAAERWAEAQAAFERSLLRTPKRTPSLLGLARAAKGAGNADAARRAYAEIATMPSADASSEAVREARAFLGDETGADARAGAEAGTRAAAERTDGDDRPNFLVIVADDLGYTDLGRYGGEIRTPNIDALAAEGLSFTQFYAAPTCSPSRSMMLTGLDNHVTGFGSMAEHLADNQRGRPGYEGALNERVLTLPTLFRDAGYRTYMAGKWHIGAGAGQRPHERGFERSFALMQGGASHFADMARLVSIYPETLYFEDGVKVEALPEDFYSSEFYADKIVEYIDAGREAESPFFAWLAFTAPHWPLQVPDDELPAYRGVYDAGYDVFRQRRLDGAKAAGIVPAHVTAVPRLPRVAPWDALDAEERRRSVRAMEIYAAMIENMDRQIGRVIGYLRETGQLDDTLVVFLSDNGAEGHDRLQLLDNATWVPANFDLSYENMGRENSYTLLGPGWGQVSSVPLRLFKAYVTEGGLRVPAIFRGPSVAAHGALTPAVATIQDLAPTLLDLAGIEPPEGHYDGREVVPMSGRSLGPLLAGEAAAVHGEDDVLGWELFGHRAVRQGRWKALWADGKTGSDDWQLFDIEKDPREIEDLGARNPDMLERLVALWESYARENGVILPIGDIGNPN